MTASKLPQGGIIRDMVNLWRRRKFVCLVRKSIKEFEKSHPPGLEAEVSHDPPTKEVKLAFTKKHKIWLAKFTASEANDICREVLHYEYCTPKEAFGGIKVLRLEQSGKELCSLSGYFEEIIKGRKRLTTVLLSSTIAAIFLYLIGIGKGLLEEGYNLILKLL